MAHAPSPDVAIIGGGIIGCSAAAMLAERGARVVLFEGSAIGAGASGRNLGVLQHPFDPVLGTLFHDSLDRYRRLAAEADSGFQLADRPAGLLLLNPDADASRAQVRRLAEAVPELAPSFMDPDAVAAAEPALTPGFAACRLETGYPVPPGSATAGWARLAERLGAQVRVGTSAEPSWADGQRVVGVRQSDGEVVAAGTVLVAAGPSAPPLADPGGTWQPITRTWGVTVQVRLGDLAPRHVVEQDEVDAVNRPARAAERAAATSEAEPETLFSIASASGVSTLGSTFLPAEPDPDRVAELLVRRSATYLPALATAPIVEVRLCARPQSVDGRPFVGRVPWAEGLYVCAGHGPWGISTGPASAALIVDALLTGTEARIPLPLRADRAPG
ncbi:MAG TPA: FAD-dependent oxidoreductase [Candidatus Limnocylindria bacterium]|nr:FAD-dependent oxidoreductase [Candidatus Limnocylindria bacterium]